MDILYPVKKTEKNEELIYSLRSLSNIQHDKVFIVGDLPNFINIKNIYYIPTNKLSNRYETTTNNIKTACQNKELSDDFILMNDDFFFLKETKEEDLILNRGLLKDTVKYYYNVHKNLTQYDLNVKQAMLELKKLGFKEPISFELHAPMIINKNKFLSIVDKINTESLHTCKRSVYGNYFIHNSKTIEDVKVLSYIPLDNFLKRDLNTISSSKISWKDVIPYISKKFPSKSVYEL